MLSSPPLSRFSSTWTQFQKHHTSNPTPRITKRIIHHGSQIFRHRQRPQWWVNEIWIDKMHFGVCRNRSCLSSRLCRAFWTECFADVKERVTFRYVIYGSTLPRDNWHILWRIIYCIFLFWWICIWRLSVHVGWLNVRRTLIDLDHNNIDDMHHLMNYWY